MKYWSGPRTYLETPKNYSSVGFISGPTPIFPPPLPPPPPPPVPTTIVLAQFDWPVPAYSIYRYWNLFWSQSPKPVIVPPAPFKNYVDWSLSTFPKHWDLFTGFRLFSLTSNIELREDLSAELREDGSVELRQ